MSKKDNRRNITTIIHDIKEDYSKKFREKIPQTKEMEEVVIAAARQAKKGFTVEWTWNSNGDKKLNVFYQKKVKYIYPKNNQSGRA